MPIWSAVTNRINCRGNRWSTNVVLVRTVNTSLNGPSFIRHRGQPVLYPATKNARHRHRIQTDWNICVPRSNVVLVFPKSVERAAMSWIEISPSVSATTNRFPRRWTNRVKSSNGQISRESTTPFHRVWPMLYPEWTTFLSTRTTVPTMTRMLKISRSTAA